MTNQEKQAAEAFWKWFEENRLPFEFLTGMTQEQIDDISERLHQAVFPYCAGLSPQVSGIVESREGFRLVISTSGQIEFFEKAKALVEMAPAIPNWHFYYLLPPLPRHVRIKFKFGNEFLDPNDIWILTMVSEAYPNNLGVHVALNHIDLHSGSEEDLQELRQLIIQLMVNIIGEESWVMDIQHLELGLLPPAPMEKGYAPLYDLPDIIAHFRKDHPSPRWGERVSG